MPANGNTALCCLATVHIHTDRSFTSALNNEVPTFELAGRQHCCYAKSHKKHAVN